MAVNLAKAGYLVNAFDLSKAACDQAAKEGLPIAAGANETVADAEVVISMLPASRHVESLYLGSDGQPGLLQSIRAGSLVIDCSTIAPASSRRVAQAAAQMGLPMLDAPVSGGTAGAAGATLTFMIGGEADALNRARPLLEAMGEKPVPCGRSRRRPGGQDLQQHAAGHPHDRNERSPGARARQRARPEGLVRDHAAQFRRQLGAREIQPPARCHGERARGARTMPGALAPT